MTSSVNPVNPALEAFVRALGTEKIWGEVLIRREGSAFELRHNADRAAAADQLKRISILEARKVATYNKAGQFRPLHSAPDLTNGWILVCSNEGELWRALQEFYPGSVPDWFGAQNGAKVTDYREFTNRQSGMYRITQLLTDEQAANVTRAACHARFCLKQRLWTVPGLAGDTGATKSAVPCLEPCAILLELARKSARIEQEEKSEVKLSKTELESFIAAAEAAIASGSSGERIGNVGSPSNPRRLQLLVEKFKQEARADTEDKE